MPVLKNVIVAQNVTSWQVGHPDDVWKTEDYCGRGSVYFTVVASDKKLAKSPHKYLVEPDSGRYDVVWNHFVGTKWNIAIDGKVVETVLITATMPISFPQSKRSGIIFDCEAIK